MARKSTPQGDDAVGRSDAATDGWDEVVLDEDFIRSAEASEPSARNRMLTARWREAGPPEPQPWRADEPPAGWFWSRRRKRRRLR